MQAHDRGLSRHQATPIWPPRCTGRRAAARRRSTAADDTGDIYLNFNADEGAPDRLAAGLGPQNLARLAAVKAEYDPDNIFRLNDNIRPTATANSDDVGRLREDIGAG